MVDLGRQGCHLIYSSMGGRRQQVVAFDDGWPMMAKVAIWFTAPALENWSWDKTKGVAFKVAWMVGALAVWTEEEYRCAK